MWKVVNHNGTTLGMFATRQDAEAEADWYRSETGNVASVYFEEDL